MFIETDSKQSLSAKTEFNFRNIPINLNRKRSVKKKNSSENFSLTEKKP